ncbi:protein plastid transcriptionally active 16, chloroplastic-like isoform X1 [Chenopodium quinoa]|uniref:protein plastid transcriptionally active 16, chloroplastic-like isoform X1 n=1 Tax=Chenopodium quinoa TaxID=63459 RepID=UPI000B77C3C2|nr:protein plastid transcriptionally active 16, chloroplastic-like isoform X1 [Chenopodium quinoa]
MAHTVPSNSFLLTTTPHSRLLVYKKPRQLTVFAKNAGPFSSFRLRKQSGDEAPSEDDGQVKNNNPFQFDWSKISQVDVKSLIPVVNNSSGLVGPGRQKDAGTVFVVGATGQAGARIAQKLLREGFKVRAGVPDLGAAQELARFASDYKIISKEELKRLNAVESTFNDAESIAKAIGNASKVVVTIGSSENGPNKEVTTSDALQVVEAAQLAGVGHLAIIYDTSPVATTNNVLDGISSFFNNLFSKSQPLTISEFLERVIQTDVRYTFLRTTFTEDFSPESSYNVAVATEGSAGTNDYKVARSQMATLVAGLFSNTAVAEDKVVNVYADPSAPLKTLDELFSAIPEDNRRKEYAEAVARAKAEEEAIKAAEQAQEAAEAKKLLEEEVKKLAEQEARAASLAEEAKEKADKAGTSLDSLLNRAKDIGSGISWDQIGSQLSSAVKSSNIELPKVQVATVRGQAKAQNLPAQKAVTKQSTPKQRSRPKAKPTPAEEKPISKESKKEVRNILGGLFKQETIYVDDV